MQETNDGSDRCMYAGDVTGIKRRATMISEKSYHEELDQLAAQLSADNIVNSYYQLVAIGTAVDGFGGSAEVRLAEKINTIKAEITKLARQTDQVSPEKMCFDGVECGVTTGCETCFHNR